MNEIQLFGAHYSKEETEFNKYVSGFVQTKNVYNLKEMIAQFSQEKNTPSFEVIAHLERLEKEFNLQNP